jgi:hypothetical protein
MRMIGIILTLSLSLLAAQAVAEEACGGASGCGSADKCARCGTQCGCQQRTCQLICGKEKVKKYCWEVKCEEFCPLLPGRRCDECNNNSEPCRECQKACKGGEKCPNPRIVTPRTANARVKKTLVKKEYECERPKYKTVVQYLCPQCIGACESGAPTPVEGAKPVNSTPTPAPMPSEAPQPKTTMVAPLPPIAGSTYMIR